MRLRAELLLVVPLLAACSGGGSVPPPQVAPGALSSQVVPEAASSQAAPATAAENVGGGPQTVSGADDLLYVGNTGNDSITVYWHAAVGNTAPRSVIAGPSTGISNPGQLAADAAHNLYVLSRGVYNPHGPANIGAAVLVFAHGASGNAAPLRRIAGSLTGLHNPQAMTVDRTTGEIYVFDSEYATDGESSLLRFAAGANGNVAPLARSAQTEQPAVQLASDSTGKNIIEAYEAPCCNSSNTGAQTLPKSFANAAEPSTLFNVRIMQPYGLADDPTTKTYVAMMSDSVLNQKALYRFAENTDGYGTYMGHPARFTPPIVSVVTSERCGTQLAVAPGPNPYTYVMHAAADGCPADAVYVYTNTASGAAAPLRVLSGPATRMSHPFGIYEGP